MLDDIRNFHAGINHRKRASLEARGPPQLSGFNRQTEFHQSGPRDIERGSRVANPSSRWLPSEANRGEGKTGEAKVLRRLYGGVSCLVGSFLFFFFFFFLLFCVVFFFFFFFGCFFFGGLVCPARAKKR